MTEREATAALYLALMFAGFVAIVLLQAWIERTPAAARKVDGWLDRFFGVTE